MDFIIDMTITTTVTAIGILMIKAIFRNKMSPKLHFLIWIILAIRILIPFFPESQLSIFNFVPMANSIDKGEYRSEQPKVGMTTTVEEGTQEEMGEDIQNISQSVHIDTNKSFSVVEILVNNITYLWLIGAAILFSYFACTYILFSHRLRKVCIYQDDEAVRILDKYKNILGIKRNISLLRYGDAPMLKGIIRPIIIIPRGYNTENLKYAIIHELCHLKNRDILANLISTILLCINWYNPIIWISHSVFRRDIELLCDQTVIEIIGQKKEYATLLLKTSFKENPLLPATTCMNSSKKEIKRRIYFMANYKRPTKVWTIIMVMVIGLFGTGCLLNERDTDLSLLMRKDGEVAQDSLKENSESDINTESIGDGEEPTQPIGDLLKQLERKQFFIQGENLAKVDDEAIVEFGKAFVNLFHGAVGEQQKVSFETYMSNKNLQKFVDMMLDLTQKQDVQGGNMIIYGFNNEFKQPRMENIADNVYYLELPFEFKGSGMTCQMLITAENKTLKLLDFYFGSKDGVDTYATGHIADRKVNNPNLWDDKEWVKGVFDKLKALENEEAEDRDRFTKVISTHPNSNIAYCYVVTSDAYILKEDIPDLITILKPDSWHNTDNMADEETPRDIIINFNEFPEGKDEKNFDYNMGTFVVNQLVIQKETSLGFDGYSTKREMYFLGSDTIKALETFIDEKAISHEELISKMN